MIAAYGRAAGGLPATTELQEARRFLSRLINDTHPTLFRLAQDPKHTQGQAGRLGVTSYTPAPLGARAPALDQRVLEYKGREHRALHFPVEVSIGEEGSARHAHITRSYLKTYS